MKIKDIHIRLLRKAGLLKYLDFGATLTLGSKKFRIPLRKGMGLANMYVKQGWMAKLIEAMDLREQDTFADVGVNLGQSLLQLHSVNSKVQYIGFEPNILCCSYVENLVRLNKMENCTIHHVALSDTRALVDFEFDSEADPRASINTRQRPGYFSKRIQVQTAVFDEEFDQPVSVIKIDVEGAELAVLKGMQEQLRKHRPLVICEVLDSHGEAQLEYTQEQANELVGLLHALEYRIFQLHQDPTGEFISAYCELEGFDIKVWEPASMQTNDYLFCHRDKLPALEEILQNKLIHA